VNDSPCVPFYLRIPLGPLSYSARLTGGRRRHYRRRAPRRPKSRFENALYLLSGLWMFELFFWIVIAEAWLVGVGAVLCWALVAGGYRVVLRRSTADAEARKTATAIRSINRGISSATRSVRPRAAQRAKR
jgi:hypothetical protein